MSKKRIVIADVAREAGFSAATVSAVLHSTSGNNTRFSDKTRDKVLAAAEKLGYRANRTFRNLNRNRQGVIGVVMGANALISTYTLNAMSEAAARRDLMVIYSHTDGQTPVFIKEDAVDGLVLFGDMDKVFGNAVERFKIPVVHINSNRRLEPGTITFDEKGGMEKAVRYLADKGRKKIALIERSDHSRHPHYSSEMRWDGICQACEAVGMGSPERYMLKNHLAADLRNEQEPGRGEPLVKEVSDFLNAHPDLDSIILNYRILASIAYEAARRCGKSIPDDLAVIGINQIGRASCRERV
jgi:LacI family transcriptional regulator